MVVIGSRDLVYGTKTNKEKNITCIQKTFQIIYAASFSENNAYFHMFLQYSTSCHLNKKCCIFHRKKTIEIRLQLWINLLKKANLNEKADIVQIPYITENIQNKQKLECPEKLKLVLVTQVPEH